MSQSQKTKSNQAQATSASNGVKVKTEPNTSPDRQQGSWVKVPWPILIKTEDGAYVDVKTEPNFTSANDVSLIADTRMPPPKNMKTAKGIYLWIATEPNLTSGANDKGGSVKIKIKPNLTSKVDKGPDGNTHILPLKKIKAENGGYVDIKTEPQCSLPGSEAMDVAPETPTVPEADHVVEPNGSGAEPMDEDSDEPAVQGADSMEEPTLPGAESLEGVTHEPTDLKADAIEEELEEPTVAGTEAFEDALKYVTASSVDVWDKTLESPRAPKVRKVQTSASVVQTSQAGLGVPHTGVAPAGTPFSDGMMGFSPSKKVDQGTLPSYVERETDPAEEQETAPSEQPTACGTGVAPEEAAFPAAEAQTEPHVPDVPGEGVMRDVEEPNVLAVEEPTVLAVEVHVEPTVSAVEVMDKVQDEPTAPTAFDLEEEFGEQTVPAMVVQEEAPEVPGDEELEETSVPAVEGWDQASDVPTAPKVRKVQPSATAVQSTQGAHVPQEVPSTADSQPMPHYITRLQARRLDIKIVPQYL